MHHTTPGNTPPACTIGRRGFVLSTLAATGSGLASTAFAQEPWPSRPVRIIVPFAAGGGSDIIARFVATKLGAALGQPFVADNKPGAGGNLGAEQGAKAAPDGYTLTLIASSYSVNPAVYKLGFDPIDDITPIVQISGGPLILVANPQTGIKSVPDLIAIAKKQPGKLNYATSGAGGITHAATELLLEQAGIRLTPVPYKGTAPALNDTMAGLTDVFFSSVPSALPLINAGKLNAVAVTTTTRLKTLPNVPTVAETLPGYDVPHWHGLVGPRGLPPGMVAKVNQAVNAMLKEPGIDEHLQKDGVSAVGGTPEQLGERIRREITRWKKLAAAGNLKVE